MLVLLKDVTCDEVLQNSAGKAPAGSHCQENSGNFSPYDVYI